VTLLASASAKGQPPVAAVAAGSSETGRLHAQSGDDLVATVLGQLERRERIAASVLVQASLEGRQLQLGGPEFISRYYQQWDANREKLYVWCELRGHVDGTPVRWQQVSDGDRLWTDQTTPSGRTVTRIDLRHVRRDLDNAQGTGRPLPAGQAGVLPIQLELLSERGGLPVLIASLQENFRFSPPVSLRLADVPVSGTIGTWKPDKLAAIVPDAAPASDAPGPAEGPPQLPPRIPASVMLLVGQDDLFPYVIEFRASDATGPIVPGDMSLYQIRPRSLLLLHLYERSFSVELEPGRFEYSPGNAEWVDLTASRLERLRQSRENRTAADSATTSQPR
jgi:hypothetical protein